MTTQYATFNRFTLEMPIEAAYDCSHQGKCDDDVSYWATRIERPEQCTIQALRDELREYGAWDTNELDDDDANWERIIWIASSNIKDEIED